MSSLACSRCGAERASDDNFCRRCGRQLTVNLPAVREVRLPARRRALPPTLVGSVAVLAVGSGLEWLARRAASSAARAAGRALVSQKGTPASTRSVAPKAPVAGEVDEFLYVRKVRLHR